MKTQAKLLEKYMHSASHGRVEWVGLRPARRQSVTGVREATALVNLGLKGDHKSSRSNGSSRQVTLINLEDIRAIESLLGRGPIDPAVLRRNIVISGLNLQSMRYQRLRIGQAVVEIRAHCHPCVRMEQALGTGAVLAMYGHAGYCATVESGGAIALGDGVERLGQESLL